MTNSNDSDNIAPVPKGELSPRALQRRLKRYFLKKTHTFFASCSFGFEKVLLEEIKKLPNISNIVSSDGGIEFCGPIDTVYEANLKLYSAHRILIRVATFKCKSYPSLFNKTKTKPWEHLLGISPSISIKVSSKKSRIHHTDNIADSIADAIKTRYQNFDRSINVDSSNQIKIFVRIFNDECTLSLDTSGEHLHKRGYKQYNVDAPIRETYASALLQNLKLYEYETILDPCCGSGTFLFEADLLIRKQFPGIDRSFSFENMPFFNAAKFNKIKDQQSTSSNNKKLIGIDINPKAIDACQKNSANLPNTDIEFINGDALDLKNTWNKRGLIVSNLPYGIRVGGSFKTVSEFYKNLGKQLAKEYSKWDVLLISNKTSLLDLLQVNTKNKIKFDNGGIKVTAILGTVK